MSIISAVKSKKKKTKMWKIHHPNKSRFQLFTSFLMEHLYLSPKNDVLVLHCKGFEGYWRKVEESEMLSLDLIDKRTKLLQKHIHTYLGCYNFFLVLSHKTVNM